ncbi:MAG: hypothetical protein GY731_16255 [Gammaproteobacteria bacterium]|nr:hypothetical protein [Gammaproteobacteria bacterium]
MGNSASSPYPANRSSCSCLWTPSPPSSIDRIYIAKLAGAIYVLNAFQKKTRKTRKQDINAAEQALKQLKWRGMGDD